MTLSMSSPQLNRPTMVFHTSSVQLAQLQYGAAFAVGGDTVFGAAAGRVVTGAGEGVVGPLTALPSQRAGSHAGPHSSGNSTPATKEQASASVDPAPMTNTIRSPQENPPATLFHQSSVQW